MKYDDRFFKFVRNFLMVYLPKNRCCSENTIKSYRETINLLRVYIEEKKGIPFVKVKFELLDHTLIGSFLDWLQGERHCSVSTRNHRLAALKSFFKYAAQEDPSLMMAYMELSKIPVKKAPGPIITYMSEKALATLLKQPPENTRLGIRDRFFMIFMYDTGARIQELLDLCLKDLHLSDSIPCVYLTGKGQKMRAVPLLKKTVRHLNLYMKHFHPIETRRNDSLLFYTVIRGKAGKMSADNVASFMKRYGVSARVDCLEVPERVFPHLLRHTRAMNLYQMGMSLSHIKDFLGHTNVSTTDIYASADISMLKAALEKACSRDDFPKEDPVWQDNEELLLHLCGLK
ncbi:MAG: tyrosine-type recombinase/integrase [Syntrophales bacterium]|nr:tyrosine-type recombinase/integrase [Syntrophales bacterium]